MPHISTIYDREQLAYHIRFEESILYNLKGLNF